MPNLIYPYLIGLVSTIVIPIAALIAYITTNARRVEYERLRQRLPLATRYDDLAMRVADMEQESDELSAELADAHRVIAEAEEGQVWLQQHGEEIAQMRVEKEQLDRHRLEYEQVTSQLADQSEKLEDATKKLKLTEFEHEAKLKHLGEMEKRLANVGETVERAESELSKLRESIRLAEDSLQKAQKREIDAERKASEAEAKQKALAVQTKDLDDRRRELASSIKSLEKESSKLSTANAKAQAELDGLDIRLAETQSHLQELRAEARKRDRVLATSDEAFQELWRPTINGDEFPKGEQRDSDETGFINGCEEYLRDLGLVFPSRTVKAFHTALKTADQTPLLVLAGISGTGKSLLPRRYAEAMGMHFLSVPVQPRWDGPQDLLGFFNYLENRYKATELVRGLIQFDEHCNDWIPKSYEHFLDDRMLIVLLDEMNLARVEYYFSEFLSRLETRRDIDIDRPEDRHKASLLLDLGEIETGSPPRIFVDRNVMFVGTMNEDESTMTLSDKVIDRAAVMRFGRPKKLDNSTMNNGRAKRSTRYLPYETWSDWVDKGRNRAIPDVAEKAVLELNNALALVGRPFGYRTRDAILAYVRQYPDQNDRGWNNAVADQIEQRIMPKLRGVDLTDDSAANAVEAVLNLSTQLEDDALRTAIEDARATATGHLFTWAGVERDAD
ncbi:MAG: AAA family ATPase [Phycisphaerales bacterium]|nr:AAA family ATPase [Phycisphaerales bacterium]